MAACGGAHRWARQLQARGHVVKIIETQFVTSYVKSNESDVSDAEAICEAIGRPNNRFVKTKTVAQQEVQAVRRLRQILNARRTAKANQIKGLVTEHGNLVRIGLRRYVYIPYWLEDATNRLNFLFRSLFEGLWKEVTHLDGRN